jgi:hypothetical protein
MKIKKIFALVMVFIFTFATVSILSGRGSGEGIIDLLPVGQAREVFAAERPPAFTHLSFTEALAEQSPREGYTLAPTLFGLTGIDTLSTFVLRTPADYGTTLPHITIDGQPPPTLQRENDNTFTLIPAVPLTANSVFVFRLAREGESDITWAFQTSVRFELMSTLPRNQATNVPVRTGIEFMFSIGNEIDISREFSIYPPVEGEFLHRDSTVIFVPSLPLSQGTIYTVTLNSGVRMPDSSDFIAASHSFAFETELTPTDSPSWIKQDPPAHVRFFSLYSEFPSFAAPEIGFRVNDHRNEMPSTTMQMALYRIDDRAQAIKAVHQFVNIPFWSMVSQEDRYVDTAPLRRVYESAHVSIRTGSWSWRDTYVLPSNLPQGFYVLKATVGNASTQMLLQISDLAVQIIGDDDRTLLWINDMNTGLPASGARVYDPVESRTYNANPQGIAFVERTIQDGGEDFQISASNGLEGVVFIHTGGWGWRNNSANDRYWTALQLDRTLFQRSDTLSLWGFVQNRHEDEAITHVTAVLTEGRWWGWHSPQQDILHRQNIPVTDGSYSAEIRLPHLDPGFYELAVFHGDVVVGSMFFSVMDYVKPPYRLTASVDKQAIFAGEEITFTAGVEFFEGTPVPDLPIAFHVSGWDLKTQGQGRSQTDSAGIITVSDRPEAAQDTTQGERGVWFSAEASLPEIGWVHESASVRVFVNDIHVQPRAVRHTKGNATLTVDVHNITLDRLNDGTAEHWGDFLCAPVNGHTVAARIYEIYWELVREGERYCHILRQNVPQYRHVRRERFLEGFEIKTDAEGVAAKDFTIPNRDRASYIARLTTRDGNGRSMEFSVFIGRDFTWFHMNASDNRLFLDGVNPYGYDIGDEVELTVMLGTEPVTHGNFLFVLLQNGIMSYHIGANPLAFTFGEEHVPNVRVFAFHFNGHTYHSGHLMTQQLLFNTDSRKLLINIEACKEDYRPGDTAAFIITATDAEGNPKAANINIALVDEALFALMDYSVDTLRSVYRTVNDWLRINLSTHRGFVSDGIDDGMYMDMAGSAQTREMMAAPAAEAVANEASGNNATRVRERFEDTALFASLRTNAQGKATLTFELPDNITSWRVTASGISDDLYAGNTVQNVRVTQPIFLHYTMNNIFLVGDMPYVGVNVYGTSLSGGEQVSFEVWQECECDPCSTHRLATFRATGSAFERVNIPLWVMSAEGAGSLVIHATVDNGLSDAVRHSYTVVNSHRHVDVARFYEVTPDTVFDVNPDGLTNITFTNRGRGQFLSDLFVLRRTAWWSGARLEGLLAQREASNLIRTHFPEVRLFGCSGDFDAANYQTPDGGIAILPYADADLQTTVMLMPFLSEDINSVTLRRYLRTVYDTSATDNKMLALYGLAMLNEPVLLDLQDYAKLTDLSVRNTAYLALGFAALGEVYTARELYTTRILPHIQRVAPYYRVGSGRNHAEILDATSITALLAAQLGMPEALGLHNYVKSNRPADLQQIIERLAFISHEIENHSPEASSITYSLFGETITRDLRHRSQYTLRIPAQNMHEFKLISVTGEVGAVSIVRIPLSETDRVETDIAVNRRFFVAGANTPATTFSQGDLVRVQITVDYSARDLTGSYVITDFLPAGLVHVANSARFGDRNHTPGRHAWVRTEGQRITFFDHNSRFNRERTYYYYARVVNPGTFTAEGTLVQSIGAREYMVIGINQTLTISGK